MSASSNPVPEGLHTLTPYMKINGASDAVEFYKQAFGAVETFRWADPDGRLRDAAILASRKRLRLITPTWTSSASSTKTVTASGSPTVASSCPTSGEAVIPREADAVPCG
jgi:hypothetical protein